MSTNSSLIIGYGLTVTGVEGNAIPATVIAVFADSNTGSDATTYTTNGGSVVVKWGDGSTPQTLGTANLAIVTNTGVSNLVSVAASHTYAEAGTYSIQVILTSNGSNGTDSPFATTVSAAASTAVIADADLSSVSATVLTNVAGTPITPLTTLVQFADANPTAPEVSIATEYSALIDWGDGSPMSLGVVTQPGGVGTTFQVGGNHTYTNAGSYTIRVLVTDDDGELVNLTNTVTVTAPVVPPPTGVQGALDICLNDMVVRRKHTLNYVANFFDENAAGLAASTFTATINWGEKNAPTTTATVTKVGTTSQYNVLATHVYRKSGKYNAVLNINGVLSSSVIEVLGEDDDSCDDCKK
jgi:hypothetical protein